MLNILFCKKYGVTRTSNDYWLNRMWAEGRHQNISSVLSVQSLSVGLPFIRCSDAFICFPSAFFAGQDWDMLIKNYMPLQCSKTASQIADCFTQFECMICEYFRQESRRWETRIFWYKVPPNIAKYTPDLDERQRGPADTDGRGRQGVEACAERALGDRPNRLSHTYMA